MTKTKMKSVIQLWEDGNNITAISKKLKIQYSEVKHLVNNYISDDNHFMNDPVNKHNRLIHLGYCSYKNCIEEAKWLCYNPPIYLRLCEKHFRNKKLNDTWGNEICNDIELKEQ